MVEGYRATLTFAKLTGDEGGMLPEEDSDRQEHSEEEPDGGDGNKQDQHRKRTWKAGPGVVTITLPLPTFPADEPVLIEFPGKLPEDDWDYFVALVTSMKAGVVRRSADEN